VAGTAAKGLAVVTCIDSRIDPLAMLGLKAGDAKIVRNAGARVTPDALRSIVLAVNLLGVTRLCIVQHTNCAMVDTTEAEIHSRIEARRGVDTSDWDFLATTDQQAAMHEDIAVIRACPLLPSDLDVGAFIFDVHSGALVPLDGS
jgi:carbonic anhydrase